MKGGDKSESTMDIDELVNMILTLDDADRSEVRNRKGVYDTFAPGIMTESLSSGCTEDSHI